MLLPTQCASILHMLAGTLRFPGKDAGIAWVATRHRQNWAHLSSRATAQRHSQRAPPGSAGHSQKSPFPLSYWGHLSSRGPCPSACVLLFTKTPWLHRVGTARPSQSSCWQQAQLRQVASVAGGGLGGGGRRSWTPWGMWRPARTRCWRPLQQTRAPAVAPPPRCPRLRLKVCTSACASTCMWTAAPLQHFPVKNS